MVSIRLGVMLETVGSICRLIVFDKRLRNDTDIAPLETIGSESEDAIECTVLAVELMLSNVELDVNSDELATENRLMELNFVSLLTEISAAWKDNELLMVFSCTVAFATPCVVIVETSLVARANDSFEEYAIDTDALMPESNDTNEAVCGLAETLDVDC